MFSSRSIKSAMAVTAIVFLSVVSCIKIQGLGPEPLHIDYVLKNANTSGEVKIIRDENYLPHIVASNDKDLYFGLGFVMAQDRFGQMDLVRRGAQGRLSEILGPTPSYHGINLAKMDALLRIFRYEEDAEAGYKAMKPEHKALLDSFTRGVNRYLEEIRDHPSFESVTLKTKPEPWRPEDSLTIMGIFGLSMCFDCLFNEYYLDRLAAELGPDKAKDFVPGYPSFAPIITAKNFHGDPIKPFLSLRDMFTEWFPHPVGSNNWVVGPSRSATGKAILANDPHVPMNNIPTFWYHCHLKGGSYDAMGMMFPGFPAFGAASNGKMAYGLTNTQVDHIDLFREKVNPENPNQYLYNNRWEEFRVVTGEVKIKGRNPMPYSYRMTRHGSVIETGTIGNYKIRKWATGEVMAMKTVDVDLATFFGGYLDLPKATNWEQFREACSRVSTGPVGWNHVYADVNGNIGYQTTAHVPIRADNQGVFMHEGWTGKGDWIGYVPFEKLPNAYNPSKGYLLSANNRVEPDGYPYYISHTYLPNRATRINEFLAARPSMTAKDMMELHADTVDVEARNNVPYIIEDLEKETDPALKQAREILLKWKDQGYRDDVDLVGPTVYHSFMEYFPTEVITDEMGKDLASTMAEGFTILVDNFIARIFPDPRNPWFDDINTKQHETRKDMTRRAMKKSLAWVSKVLGADPADWKWGNFHKLTMGHSMAIIPSPILRGPKNLLVRGPYPLPGAKETINNNYYVARKKTGFFIIGGSSSRFIVDFSHPEWAYMSASTGMSDNPMMPNFDNLTEKWTKVEYIRMYMNEEDFSKNAKGALLIKP